MYNYGLLLVLLDLSFDLVGSVSQLEIDKHLELGREFLVHGQLQDALSHYHVAIEGNPNNYLAYYNRGMVYLALGKAKFAILDLDKVLELKPDFTGAKMQRGNVLFKQAKFDLAGRNYKEVLEVEPDNEEAATMLFTISNLETDMQYVEDMVKNRDCKTAIQQITRLIETCPWSLELRELRAECHDALGDYMSAISDIRSTTKLLSDNTEGYYKLSAMHYRVGQVEESLREIRECLKLDPEHKKCFPFYKKVKEVSKFLGKAESLEESNPQGCIESAERVLRIEQTVKYVRYPALQFLCRCYTANSEPNRAVKSCQEALKIREEPSTLCDSAEAYLANELYDDAIRDYKRALDIDPYLQKAKRGLQKAQQRQKISETRDYYKILGVLRTASKREIIKAYRKAAQKWHPDNFQEGEEKKQAQKKFIDIAAAKEVLTDDEKRAKFDQGEDPLDPESGKHQQGFNPFQEFHHFHGSPFQFKFHFN
ncbi:PREDICTED: dnaJ homolog subfamily C member 3 [Polistes canadensis]|uniref:dnaJ homolog subfamily C member 3 n=1 Tax=Polistes canadensis TaxID=91411 RepID=UPI000718C16F|nr:PREDICTED: dnaJ homolog subfamily C member 3 [Polistes canadensis]